MTRPRPAVVRRVAVAATWAAVAVAAVAAMRAAVDRAARPPTRCASELGTRGVPGVPGLLARSGR